MSEFPLPKIKSARQKLRSLFEQGRGEAEIGIHARQRFKDTELHSARSPSEDDIRDSIKCLPYIPRNKRTLIGTSFRMQDESTRSQPRLGYNKSKDLIIYDNLSRDISHIRDRKERASSQLRYNRKELREIVGVKKAQIQEEMPLPTDITEVEAILIKDNILGSRKEEEFQDESPTHNLQEESDYTFDDKLHENFVTDLTNAKKAYYEYRNTKRSEIQKESELFKSPNSNLSFSIPKLYGLGSSEIHKFHKRTKSSKIFDRKTMDETLNQLEEKIIEWANVTSDDTRSYPARGPPSGRREVELLETWLSYMLDIYVESADNISSEQRERAAQLIYAMCFKEVIRQVSVHCVERGRLLDRIWKASLSLFTKNENSFARQIEEIKSKFKEIVIKNRKEYERNLDVAVKKYSEINAELRKSNRTNEDLSKQIRTLNTELEETKVRNKQLREAIDVFIKSSKENSLIKSSGHFEDSDLKASYIQRFENKLMISSSPHTRSITTSTSDDFDQIISPALNSSNLIANPSSISNSVLIQGFFDETNAFHRIRQFHKDTNGLIIGVDYDGDIISLVENKNKATNTSTEGYLKVMFLTEEECRYMWDRMVLLDNIETCSLIYEEKDAKLQENAEVWKRNLIFKFDQMVKYRLHAARKMKNKNAGIQVPDMNNTQVHSSESSYVKSDSDDEIKIVSYKDSHRLQSEHSEAPLNNKTLHLDIESLSAHLDQLKNLSDSILQKAEDLHNRNILLNDPVLSSLHADLLSAWSVINQDIQIIQNLKNMLQGGKYQHYSEESSDLSDSDLEYSEVDQDLLIDIAMRMSPITKRRSYINQEEQVKIQNLEILQRVIKLSCRYDRETHIYGKNSLKSNKLLQMIIRNIKRARYSKVAENGAQTDLTWEMVHTRNYLVAKSNLVKKLSSEIARKLRSFEKKDEAKEDRKKVDSLLQASEIRPTRLKKEWSKEEELTSINSTPNSVHTFRFARSRDPPATFSMFCVFAASYAKKPHPASQLVTKILTSTSNKTKASTMATLSIKRLSKLITSTYVSRIVAIRENPLLKRVPLHEMLYDDLNQKYGLKNMTDKKMKEIIYSGIANVDKSLKIHNFMKFLGLFEDYTVADLNHYISAFEFLAINTSGQLEIDEQGLDNQVHISKAQICALEYFEQKLPKEAWERMKQEIESIKEPDLDTVQKSASKLKLPSDKVNIDKLLMLFISHYQRMKRQVHLKICRVLDDEVPSESGFNEEEFISLVFKLNSSKVTREELVSLFGIFGDFIIGEESGKPSREKMILLEHVLSICVDLGVVSYEGNEFVRESLVEVE